MLEILVFLFVVSLITFITFISLDLYSSNEQPNKTAFLLNINRDITKLSQYALSLGTTVKFDLNNNNNLVLKKLNLNSFNYCKPLHQINPVFFISSSGEVHPLKLICLLKNSEIEIFINENGIVKENNG